MLKKKFSASLAPTIKKIVDNLGDREGGKQVKAAQLKKPRMGNSKEPLLEKATVIKNEDLHFKIGDSYYQRDIFGKTVRVGALSGEMSIIDMGKKKTCPRCKQEFFTGPRRSQVLCPECKEKIKTHPKIYTKICPICHEEYSSRRNDAQTCPKDSCRKALYRKKKRDNPE